MSEIFEYPIRAFRFFAIDFRNRKADVYDDEVADALRARLGTGVTVTDLTHTRHIIASSLTAVDLSGLTEVELGFALALTAAAT